MSEKQLVTQTAFKLGWQNIPEKSTDLSDGFYAMRHWQISAFELLKDSSYMILNAPMGSGKSWMMCLLSAYKMQQNKSLRTIIAVPQTIIAPGFIDEKIEMPGGERIHWRVRHNLCGETKSNRGTVNYIVNWLASDIESFDDRTIICTHATLVALYRKLKSSDRIHLLQNLLVWVDEAHHVKNVTVDGLDVVSNNGLGELVACLLMLPQHNTQIGLTTASFFRGDRCSLLTPEMESQFRRFNLPYDEYLKSMKYLRSFSMDFVLCGSNYYKAIEVLIQQRQGKDIIYIPHPTSQYSSGDKYKEVGTIIETYSRVYGQEQHMTNNGVLVLAQSPSGFKILDLVNESRRREKKQVLNETKQRDDLDSIVALGMFKEGANWIWADRSIIVGSRSSLVDIIQMIGRLFRDAEGKEHVEVFQLLPFALDQQDEARFKENLNNYLKAIYASLILENVLNPVKIKFCDKKREATDQPTEQVAEDWLAKAVPDDSKRLAIIDDMNNRLLDIGANNQGVQVSVLREEYDKIAPRILEGHGITEYKQEIASQIWNMSVRRSLNLQGISVENIDFEILQNANPLDYLVRYTSGVCTVNTLQKLREAIQCSRVPLTSGLIMDWVRQYIDKYGKKPKQQSGVVEFATGSHHGITWSAINMALWRGGRSLPGGLSLADLIALQFGIKNKMKLPSLTEERIYEWVAKFIEKYKRKPLKSDGVVEFVGPGYEGETWEVIDSSLLAGVRGLSGGSSLAKFIEQKFGIRSYINPSDFTLDIVRFWIHQYIAKYKTKPTAKSGIIEFADSIYTGITWAVVAHAMQRGSRGLSGGVSLAQFIEQEFKIQNHRTLQSLTKEIIIEWVEKFMEKNSRKPTQNDGIIEFATGDFKNMRWSTLNMNLWKGGRGLAKDSSLAQFIEDHFAINNRNNPPDFTEDFIFDWIGKHIAKNGEKPSKASGEVEFAEGYYKGVTWSLIDSAFKRGIRGLSISSLAKFIQSKFGLKRRTHPPDLLLELILSWVQQYIDKYNKKPTYKDGIVEFAIGDYKGETWLAIDAALRRGRRGLTGGLSLANLIHNELGVKNHLRRTR